MNKNHRPKPDPRAALLLQGRLHDPFSYLGLHQENGGCVIRVFFPFASEVNLDTAYGSEAMQRIHPDGVPRRLDVLRASPRGLEDAELRLELRRVAAERLEGLLHLLGVVAVAGARQVLDPRERGQRGWCAAWFLCRHWRRLSKYAAFIGWRQGAA